MNFSKPICPITRQPCPWDCPNPHCARAEVSFQDEVQRDYDDAREEQDWWIER